jgi:tetratricopeptide (TPR) repeat protein
MEEELEQALVHGDRTGDERERAWILQGLARAAFLGPTPVQSAMSRCQQIAAAGSSDPTVEAVVLAMMAGLHAMDDDSDKARRLFAESRRIGEEFGLKEWIAALPLYAGLVEVLAGNGTAAEAEFRVGYATSDQIGDRSRRSNHAAFLAEALYLQSRYAEAEDAAAEAARESSPDDLFSQVVWHGVTAKVVARDGDSGQAERLASTAVAIARATDCLSLQGYALLNLSDVLAVTGRRRDAAASVDEALARFRAKGDRVSTRNAERILATFGLTAVASKQYRAPVSGGEADGDDA